MNPGQGRSHRAARPLGVALLLCLLQATTIALPASDLEYNLRVSEIAPETWVVIDRDYFWSNTLVARMPDGTVLLASSPFERLGAETLLDWIDRELKPRRIVAVNTHFHRDGTGGNQSFREHGVTTWASRLTVELQSKQSPSTLEEAIGFYGSEALAQRVLDTKSVAAEHTFDLEQGKRLEFGGEDVELFFPGHAHSPDNLVVWFPRRGILFGGCIVKPGERLGYLGAADVANWSAATRRLLEFEAGTVVPGHGKVGGPELLERTIRLSDREAAKLEP